MSNTYQTKKFARHLASMHKNFKPLLDFKPKDCASKSCLLLQNYEDNFKNRGAMCRLNNYMMGTFDIMEILNNKTSTFLKHVQGFIKLVSCEVLT